MSVIGKVVLCTNNGAGNYDKFWPGGKAMLTAMATWSAGSIKLQVKAGDNSTYLDVPSSTLSANGTLEVNLPPGQIRAVVATSTGVYAELISLP